MRNYSLRFVLFSFLAFGCSSDTSSGAADASVDSGSGGASGTGNGGAGGKATGGSKSSGGTSSGGASAGGSKSFGGSATDGSAGGSTGGAATGGAGGKGGAATGGAGGKSSDAGDAGPGPIAHIFYIMMENHAENEIIGNTTDAPYLNQLANQYGVATQYYGVTHPSLPNYLAAISGDFQGIWDDCKAGQTVTCAPEEFVPGSGDNTANAPLTSAEITSSTAQAHWFSGRNIVDQLEAKGLTWKAYMQSIPTSDPTVEYAPVDTLGDGGTVPRKLYAQKHNPFMYFSDIRGSAARMNKIVPFTQFDTDLAGTVPNFVWISPDQCNDMHGLSSANANAASVNIPNCASPASGLDHSVIKLGDDFVKATVQKIMASSAWKENSVIFIAWDEDDYAGFAGCCQSPTGAVVDGGAVTLGGANAPALVITSKNAEHQSVDTPYNHYSSLATIESLWGLGCLGKACNIADAEQMTSLFVP